MENAPIILFSLVIIKGILPIEIHNIPNCQSIDITLITDHAIQAISCCVIILVLTFLIVQS